MNQKKKKSAPILKGLWIREGDYGLERSSKRCEQNSFSSRQIFPLQHLGSHYTSVLGIIIIMLWIKWQTRPEGRMSKGCEPLTFFHGKGFYLPTGNSWAPHIGGVIMQWMPRFMQYTQVIGWHLFFFFLGQLHILAFLTRLFTFIRKNFF